MPRSALTFFLLTLSAAAHAGAGTDPHLDPTLLPLGCVSCHRGHGVARSSMLPAAQAHVCLACHDTQARLDSEIRQGRVSVLARPTLLAATLTQPYRHPLSTAAFSSREPGAITCTSCHSPHRGLRLERPRGDSSVPRLSPRDPSQLEHELCESCHGNLGAATLNVSDLARLLEPSNRSYHPVHGPAVERSPSLKPSWSGRELSCGDCHGPSDPGAPAGPHGSAVEYVLTDSYATVDGGLETATTYALCYRCHDRESVLDRSPFATHRLHVVDVRASCATCHNPHGALVNRALIRFGEESRLTGVAPSARSGRLEFTSSGPGSGSCTLSCHGRDHEGETYGVSLLPAF